MRTARPRRGRPERSLTPGRGCPDLTARSIPPVWGQAGVNLIELMVVLAIITVTAGVVWPVVGAVLFDAKSEGATQQLVEALRVARQNAIATVSTYRVDIQGGRRIVVDCQDDPVLTTDCPANRPPRTEEDVIHGASIAVAPAGPIDFTRSGAATPVTFTVTYPNAATWQVVVNAPGGVRACNGVCP